MSTNEGKIDRWLRATLGVLVIASGALLDTGGLAVQIVGATLLATSIMGWCPLYTLLHIDTRRVKHG